MFTYEKAHAYKLGMNIKCIYVHARDLITSSEKILFFFDFDDVYNFLLILFSISHGTLERSLNVTKDNEQTETAANIRKEEKKFK